MNRITLVGRSGADAKVEMSQSGNAYCKFSVATSHKEKEEFVSTWHNVIMFGKLAEGQGPMIKKGTKVFVEGRISHEKYTDKNGNERTTTSVIAFTVAALQKEPVQNDAYAGQDLSPTHPANQTSSFTEADIPF
jgi:single-strand DNA-binding protein